MKKSDFVPIMAYIGAAIGKPQSDYTVEVYFDLLGDLPKEALQIGAKRVILLHPWSTFPSVAELREAAVETLRGVACELSSAEAWQLAWKATGKIDPEVEGSIDRGCDGLPPLIVEAMKAFGIGALCFGKEPISVVRGQFVKIYEQLQRREHRVGLLPTSVTKAIENIGKDAALAEISDSRRGLRILQVAGIIGSQD